MEKGIRKSRRKETRPSRLMNWLRGEGRRCCAAALCVSMVVGNTANLAWAAEGDISDSFLFQMDRSALYDALQEAVTAEDTFEFAGEAAEEYELLLNDNEAHDGELYELKPEIEHEKGTVGLRIFARLDGEMSLDNDLEADLMEGDEEGEKNVRYEITGNEEFIFLLTNSSHREQRAVIQVGEKKSDVITIVPKSTIQAGLEGSAYGSAGDFGPGEQENPEETAAEPGNAVIPGGGSSGGSGGGGGGGSHGGSHQEEVRDPENNPELGGDSLNQVNDNEQTENKNQDDSQNAGQEAGKEDTDKNISEGSEASDDKSDSSDSKSEDASDNHPDSNPDKNAGAGAHDTSQNMQDSSGNQGSDTGNQGGSENAGDNSGSADDSGDSGNDSGSSDSNSGGSGDNSGSSDSSSGSDSNSGGSDSSSDSNSSGSDSGSGSSDGNSGSSGGSDSSSNSSGDSGSSNSGGEPVAWISLHGVSLVASSLDEIVASPSNVEKQETEAAAGTEEAEPAETATDANAGGADDASPSDSEETYLDGDIYEAVLMNDTVVVAFVTTAAELKLDEEDYREATPADALTGKIHVFDADMGDVMVEVMAADDVLPEEAELRIREISEEEDKGEYEEVEQALREAGNEFTGMMAFDISFWLDGVEIEPTDKVQVSMRVNSEKLREEADPESLEVHHLAELKKHDIVVETVADSGEKTEGTIEMHEAEPMVADFEVEGFSTFTITWTGNNGNSLTVEVEYWTIDSAGTRTLITEDTAKTMVVPGFYHKKISIAENTEIVWNEVFGDKVYGYDLKQIKIAGGGEGSDWTKYTDSYKIRVEENGSDGMRLYNQTASSGSEALYKQQKGTVYLGLYYQESGENKVKITDTVEQDGLFTADTSEIDLPALEEGESIEYRWYKMEDSDDANKWQWIGPIDRTRISGDNYNISEEGKNINVALDAGKNALKDGIRYYYKVEVVKKSTDSSNNEVEKILGKSASYLVEYYGQLQNGSFEEPDLGDGSGKWTQYPNGTEDLIWKSTAGNVEITQKGNQYHPEGTRDVDAVEGTQYAELNAEEAGALYQDVLTVPGSTLYWNLYHRSRKLETDENGNLKGDTMYVLIMPTKLAKLEEITTQEQVLKVMEHLDEYPGAKVQDITTNSNMVWENYSGTYLVQDGQYLTRFFFVAGNTAGSITEGNFLDNVWFSPELPPPSKDKGSLWITKTVSGLSDKDASKYQVQLTVEGPDNTVKETVLTGFKKNTDGTYSAAQIYSDIEVGSYTITERVPDAIKNDLQGGYREPETTIKDDSGETKGTQKTVSVSRGKTASVNILNQYAKKNLSFKITKEVTGNMADRNGSFTFEYKIDEEKQGTFTLNKENGWTKSLEVPFGAKLEVREQGAADYETYIVNKDKDHVWVGGKWHPIAEQNGKKGYLEDNVWKEIASLPTKEFVLDSMSEDTEIIFINHKSVNSPTGVYGNKLPYLLMLAMAALGMAGMAATGTTVKARKKNDEQ